ncbi:DUF4157 domain-containing protein [Nannocystis pusilla]|uniref:eCIS core domain-containing protein n=1 Tax=Nannocystis pusilla TaxID=889268 RepID=UPI003B825F61
MRASSSVGRRVGEPLETGTAMTYVPLHRKSSGPSDTSTKARKTVPLRRSVTGRDHGEPTNEPFMAQVSTNPGRMDPWYDSSAPRSWSTLRRASRSDLPILRSSERPSASPPKSCAEPFGPSRQGSIGVSRGQPGRIDRACSRCAAGTKQMDVEDELVQRRTNATDHAAIDVDGSRFAGVRGERGQPLPLHVRQRMAQALGYDFSRVHVHTSARASELAGSIRAEAFTVGRDIVFARGRFQPDTPQGLHLLAHELVHSAQQEPHRGSTLRAPSPRRIRAPFKRDSRAAPRTRPPLPTSSTRRA